MRLDQMDGIGFVPERKKRLSRLERRILLDALAALRAADGEGSEKDYVVSLSMAMPSGFVDRLDRALLSREPNWPKFKPHPERWEPTPMELSGKHGTDVGMWSVLPSRLYRKITRHSGAPDESLITAMSQLLDFCEWCSDVFQRRTAETWPDAPPFTLAIESTHYLVASQRFASQQDGDKWLTLATEAFNAAHLIHAMQEIDKKTRGEEPAFRGPHHVTRVQERHRGWMPRKGLQTEDIREAVATMRASGIQNTDRAIAQSFASLRDRGYAQLRGQFQSPDTRWLFPAECVLTGIGFLVASNLAKG